MNAVYALGFNTIVAILFASTFLAIATFYPAYRRVMWFFAAYAVGALTPASELLVRFSDYPKIFIFTSFLTFLLSFCLTGVALAAFYQKPIPWAALALNLLAGLVLRAAIWDGPRNTQPYEFLYQLPFAIATATCATIVLGRLPRSREDTALGALFVIVSVQFLIKPFAAVALHSGNTAQAYAGSAYALFSQSTTGILLIATGLVLVLVVIQTMLREARQESEVDALSGVWNRRGFASRAEVEISRATATRSKIALLALDIDHFKQVNDTYGHNTGDKVIETVGGILNEYCPAHAVIGRMGGEEFAVLLPNSNSAVAALLGEAIRANLICQLPNSEIPTRVTISAGVATAQPPCEISDLMRDADHALYAAKRGGRNRVVLADGTVSTLQRQIEHR